MSKPILLLALVAGSALGLSATAHAQTMTASITNISDRPSPNDASIMPLVAINSYECETDATITLLMAGVPATNTILDFWRGTGCNDAAVRASTTSTACVYLFSITTGGQIMWTLEPIAFSSFGICDNADGVQRIYILSTTTERSTEAVSSYVELPLTVDTTPPGAPTSVVASNGDTQAIVSWTVPSTTETMMSYRVYVDTNVGAATSSDGGTDADGGTDTDDCTSEFLTSGDVLDLSWTPPDGVYVYTITAATTYDINPASLGMEIGDRAFVAVASQDVPRNRSGLSNGACFTRIQTSGFFDSYTANGGNASTCSVTNAGASSQGAWWLIVAACLGVLLLARKRARMFALFLGVGAALASAAPASAQDSWTEDWTSEFDDVESPEHFGVEARFGQYAPEVGNGSFEQFFGDDQGPLWAFEFDAVLYRIPYVGTISVGAGFGRAAYAGNAIDAVTGDQLSGSEQTNLTLVPFSLLAVLRIDTLARQFGMPFVFTGKLGEDMTWWTATTGAVTDAQGLSYGLRWGLQLGFELDFFDRGAARALDEEWGINHAFLFGEIFGVSGQGRALITSSSGWVAGLGFNL